MLHLLGLSAFGQLLYQKFAESGSAAIKMGKLRTFPRLCVRQASTAAVPNKNIRNIGVSAHIDSGKTTVTERLLYYTGRIDSMHEVRGRDQVGATMDFMDLERQRGITIQSAATFMNWAGHSINVIDTPGHVDFTVEVERALRVLDGAVLLLCAVGGVQSQTLTVNRQMARYNVPFITFVNKLDRMGADPHRAVKGLRNKLGHNAALTHLPIGAESELKGIIDLITERALYFDGDDGLVVREEEIPSEMRAEAEMMRAELIEHAANGDEELCEMYMEQINPTADQLRASIRRAVLKRAFIPVLCGSALKNKGVQPLLDAIVNFLPCPDETTNRAFLEKGDTRKELILNPERSDANPFVGMAFKLERSAHGQLTYLRCYQGKVGKGDVLINTREGTKVRVQRLVRMHANEMQDIDDAYAGDICATFGIDCASGDTFTSDPRLPVTLEGMHVPEPVVSMSIQPANRKDGTNFLRALNRFTKEDPTFRKSYEPESRETIVSGMGELQLEIYASRMKSEFGCEVVMGQPKVAFRETIANPCKFQHLHRKQTGGQGQYGKVFGFVEPMQPNRNTEVEFVDETIGSGVPKNLVPSLRKGFDEMLDRGPVAGFKITGIKFRLTDGDTHAVDSTEIAMINTAKGAMEDVFEDGQWVIMEPIMKVEVVGPSEFQGPVVNGIQRRSAVINNVDVTSDGSFLLECEVPLKNMFGYSMELRSSTQGKGEFTMEYQRYAPVDPQLEAEIVKSRLEDLGIDNSQGRRRA